MGFRFRKSVKLMPGVKMNLGKKGASVSFGGRGARVTVGKKTRTTVGIPGTGLSYTATSSRPRSGGGASGGFWLILILALVGLIMLVGVLGK